MITTLLLNANDGRNSTIITKRRKLFIVTYAGELIHYYKQYSKNTRTQLSTFYEREDAAQKCVDYLNKTFNTDQFSYHEVKEQNNV